MDLRPYALGKKGILGAPSALSSKAVSLPRGSVSPTRAPRQCRGFPGLEETRPRGIASGFNLACGKAAQGQSFSLAPWCPVDGRLIAQVVRSCHNAQRVEFTIRRESSDHATLDKRFMFVLRPKTVLANETTWFHWRTRRSSSSYSCGAGVSPALQPGRPHHKTTSCFWTAVNSPV